jgi:starch phosphorylase/maltose phosphorylase
MTTREKLNALADNLWWSWNPHARELFRRLNPDVFVSSNNTPHAALAAADEDVLDDAGYQEEVDAVYDRFQAYMQQDPFFDDAPSTAYFCMEYGLHESMPLYSGGLGVLAGDHSKAASDLGLPFTAVGFFLREGYFQQSFDVEGWQQAQYPVLDPNQHPVQLATDDDGDPVRVHVPLGTGSVAVRAWEVALGQTTLYLLDTDFEANSDAHRRLTRRLYGGDNHQRLQQEIVLGIGGLRMLREQGVDPDVYHANEGHCAFLMFELMREQMAAGAVQPDAEAWVREHCVFTTHTPVPAGHDRFGPDLFRDQMQGFAEESSIDADDLLPYGRVHPDDPSEPFCMTVLGLKLSRAANGVSELNGHVARQQWQDLHPDRPLDDVPIGAITNGVHMPTWTAQPAKDFIKTHLGDNWLDQRQDADFWDALAEVSDEDLWFLRSSLRRRLLRFVNEHVQTQSLPQHPNLDPEALTIGFARRFATYKRAPLIFSDLERARALFADDERPLQLLYAGKAHPADDAGKRYIQRIYEISQQDGFNGRVVFLENYNMEIGRMLVSGCDVWLNNPRRPLEASGTSGQKITPHGGLNLSVLDGWWPEGYNGDNGWAIGKTPTGDYGTEDPEVQDRDDARSLYHQLEDEVIPAFYDRDDNGLPTRWIARMREAMTTLLGPFTAKRMVIDYVNKMYRVPVEE